MTQETPPVGMLDQLRQRLDTGLSMVQVRLGLLGTELEIEKQRLASSLAWGAAALVCLSVALVLLCGFVVLLLSEGYRLAALGVLTLAFLTGAAMLMRTAQHKLQTPSNLFRASLAELDRDRAALGRDSTP